MPFESTESEDYNHEYYKEPEYELEKREAFEDEGIYDVFSDEYPADASSTEYSENMDNLCTFDRSLKGAYNPTDNPIVCTLWGDDEKTKPVYVVALIEKRHRQLGRAPRQNKRALAARIRSRGVIKDNKHLDQCGHIIAHSLGGRIEYGNLIPQGRTTNLAGYRQAENVIRRYLDSQDRRDPRALVQIGLVYGHEMYPYRPTRFYYSYVLYDDSDEERNNHINSDALLNPPVQIQISVAKGQKIIVKGDQVIKARTRSIPNRVSTACNNWAFWLQIAASLVVCLTPVPAPVPIPAKVPVADAVRQAAQIVKMTDWVQQLQRPMLVAAAAATA